MRVLVADDHRLARERLQRILEAECDVVAALSDGANAVSETLKLSPDVLVCDLAMAGRSGFDVARELRRLGASVKTVFVTTHAEPAYVVEAFRIGVLGFVLKSAAGSELCPAVRAAARGQRFVSSRLRGAVPSEAGGSFR